MFFFQVKTTFFSYYKCGICAACVKTQVNTKKHIIANTYSTYCMPDTVLSALCLLTDLIFIIGLLSHFTYEETKACRSYIHIGLYAMKLLLCQYRPNINLNGCIGFCCVLMERKTEGWLGHPYSPSSFPLKLQSK